MRQTISTISALSILTIGSAFAQSANFQMLNADERLGALKVGIDEICVPTQREQKSTKNVVKARGKSVGLRKMRSANKTRALVWQVGKTEEVAILDMGGGCTVSTSFEKRDADKLLPGLRSWLAEDAYSEEMAPAPTASGETGVTAYCRTNEAGGFDAMVLYENIKMERPDVGSKRPVEVTYLSVVVPPQTFCSSSD
ncbi:MAG: hypothetical protein ACWA5T_08750 [Parvularcula sp.]